MLTNRINTKLHWHNYKYSCTIYQKCEANSCKIHSTKWS